jgi:AmmeMemoRadiSam system protein A
MSPLSDEDGRSLLGIARRALEQGVRGLGLPERQGFTGALAEQAGAFVTLRHRGALRGCIGQVEASQPLALTVAECGVAAALRDPRFAPVDPSEVADLAIEINILSPPFDIRPDEIVIGKHGLLVSSLFSRGLLLPEVAVEWGWDAERFLDETCRKAGLHAGTWRGNVRVQGFTTQAFAEPGFHAVIPASPETRSSQHK